MEISLFHTGRTVDASFRSAICRLGIAVLLMSRCHSAPEHLQLRENGILVLYPAAYEEHARTSLNMLRQSRDEIALKLGLPSNTEVSAKLVGDSKLFDDVVGNGTHLRILGVAYSPQGRIVINLARLTAGGQNNLYETLAHEMVHVMLGRLENERNVRLSRWFHEGVACWLGRVLPPLPDDHRLSTAAITGELIPFYLLEKSFPPLQTQSELAYLESEAFVRFILRRHGNDAIARVLASMKDGDRLDDGFMNALGVNIFEEEKQWMEAMKGSHPILRLVYHNFTILSFGAVLTIIAFVAYRIRRAKILQRLEREERILLSDEDILEENDSDE